MTAPGITFALLLSRPHLVGYAHENLLRLEAGAPGPTRRVVVLTGQRPQDRSLGVPLSTYLQALDLDAALETYGPACTWLVRPGYQVGEARQAALTWALGRASDDVLMFVDDDDWYTTGYVPEALSALSVADVVGKRPGQVVEHDGHYLVPGIHEHSTVRWVTGGTLAFHVKRIASARVTFPDMACSEDVAFCEAAGRAGLRVYATSARHYCYRRDWPEGHRHAFTRSPVRESAAVGYPAVRLAARFAPELVATSGGAT